MSTATALADPAPTQDAAAAIVRLIRQHRFDLSTEKCVQAQLEEALAREGIVFEREKRLSAQDIPDFVLAGGVVLECKMRGARKMDIYKQLRRYAVYPDVTALILVSNLAMGLPPEINGKPVYAASLSRGWI
ncbi:MAG: hypothetical protein OEL20_05265 [Sulfuritalea sp.]|nr:hypothetical protein [Sulfuritalea sp.]